MAEVMAEAKYMEERQSLVFQTERLKVAEEMAKTKVQIPEEPCVEILRTKRNWHEITVTQHLQPSK